MLLRSSKGKPQSDRQSQNPLGNLPETSGKLSKKQSKPMCRRQWKELEHSDLIIVYVNVHPPLHILSISVLFNLKLTLQVIISPCEILRYEMQNYFLCTVLSVISSAAFITCYVCISFLLAGIVTPCLYGKFMKMFLKESPNPPLPCWLLKVEDWRKLTKGNKILIDHVWANTRIWSEVVIYRIRTQLLYDDSFCSIKQWLHLSPEKLLYSSAL